MTTKKFVTFSILLLLVAAIVVTATSATCSSPSASSSTDFSKRFADFKNTASDNAASWKMFDRIVIIPDLHGDYQKIVSILVGTKLATWKNETVKVTKTNETTGQEYQDEVVRSSLQWSASRTLAVQLGDMVDRGPYDKEVMELVMDMQQQALKFGDGQTARMAVLLGNHEILQLQNLTHYAHREAALSYGGRGARQDELSPSGRLGQWLRSLPLAVEAWDTVFVHAGLTPKVAELGIRQINRLGWRDLDINHRREGPFIFEDSGPVWTRMMVYDASKGNCKIVDECLELVGRKRIVVGHTPQRGGPALMCDEKLLAADVGLSRWMYNGQSIVEMTKDLELIEKQQQKQLQEEEGFPVAFNELFPEEDIVKQQQEEAEKLLKLEKEAKEKDLLQQQQQQEAEEQNGNDKHHPTSDLEEQLKNDPSALEEIMQVMHEQRNVRRHREDDDQRSAPSPDL